MQINTFYTNYNDYLLDVEIFGEYVSTPQQSLEELKESLYEEYKRRKPMPTLEYKRYELSRLVGDDFRIEYIRELDLQDNESLVDLKSRGNSVREVIDFEDLKLLAEDVVSMFSYEKSVTSDICDDIITKYDLSTGKLFNLGVQEITNIVGSVEEDTETVLSDDEIDNLGKDNDEDNDVIVDFDDSLDSDDEDDDSDFEDFSDWDDEDDESGDFEVEDDSVDYEVEEDSSDYEVEEDFEEVALEDTDDLEDDTDSGDFEEFDSNDDSDEDDFSEEFDLDDTDDLEDDTDSGDFEEFDSNDDSDDESDDFEDFDIDDFDDIASDDELNDFEEQDSNDEDAFKDFDSDDIDSDDDNDFEDVSGEDSFEIEENSKESLDSNTDNDFEEFESDKISDFSDNIDSESNDIVSDFKDNIKNNKVDSNTKEVFNDTVVDEVVANDFEEYISPSDRNKNVEVSFVPNKVKPKKFGEETVDRDSEPKDIKEFLRKYPRCEYSFALKYFTKKQINDAIKRGRIIKKGNTLRV